MLKNTQNKKGIENKKDKIKPLKDLLSTAIDPILNVEITEGAESSNKSDLLHSALLMFSSDEVPHYICCICFLLRELVDKFAKEQSAKIQKVKQFEILESRCISLKELESLKNISHPKYRFIEPNKIEWSGFMDEGEKNTIMSYSHHPCWKQAIWEIFNTMKTEPTEDPKRTQKVENFLKEHGHKFSLSKGEISSIAKGTSELKRFFDTGLHNTALFKAVGDALKNPEEEIPNGIMTEYNRFFEQLKLFSNWVQNFKFKPIGKLKQIDEIVNEPN